MTQRRRESEDKILSEPVATRLLDRASQLDAALKSGAMVADLRAAAVEAGISLSAFDAALAELDVQAIPLADTRRRDRKKLLAGVGLVAMVGAVALAVMMFVIPTLSAPYTEQTLQIRCISPSQVDKLTLPIAQQPNAHLKLAWRRDELTISGTPEQVQAARALVEQNDNACRIDVPKK